MKLTDVAIPDSLYGVSKLFAEDLGKLFSLQTGIEFVALRIGWYLQGNNFKILKNNKLSIININKFKIFININTISKKNNNN